MRFSLILKLVFVLVLAACNGQPTVTPDATFEPEPIATSTEAPTFLGIPYNMYWGELLVQQVNTPAQDKVACEIIVTEDGADILVMGDVWVEFDPNHTVPEGSVTNGLVRLFVSPEVFHMIPEFNTYAGSTVFVGDNRLVLSLPKINCTIS